MDHMSIYCGHTDRPYGREYAAMVGKFQEGFLRDRVTRDLDVAFERAVEKCELLLPVIKSKAGC